MSLTNKYLNIILLISGAIASFLMISSQSLWIDEGTTALLASFKDMGGLYTHFANITSSEKQMPGYVFTIWVWAKVFGISEYALRSLNIIYFLIFLTSLLKLDDKKVRIYAVSFAILSPFIWYNMNEARSTIAILAFSSWSLIYTLKFVNHPNRVNLHIILISICLGALHNMLFYFLLPVCAYLALVNYKKWLNRTRLMPMLVIAAAYTVPIAIIMLYYVQSVFGGAGGIQETPSLKNLLFGIYEFIGLAGIGPPRNELRNDLMTFMSFLPQLLISTTILLWVVFVFVRFAYRESDVSVIKNLISSGLLGLVFFVTTAYVADFRFWGRHLIFLFPSLIIIAANFTMSLPRFKTSSTILWMIIMGYSIYNLRFNFDYQKDDYKGAIKEVKEILDRKPKSTVLIAGYKPTCMYYGVFFNNDQHLSSLPISYNYSLEATEVSGWSSGEVSQILDRGNYILLLFNKDLFDKDRHIKRLMEQNPGSKIVHKDYTILESSTPMIPGI